MCRKERAQLFLVIDHMLSTGEKHSSLPKHATALLNKRTQVVCVVEDLARVHNINRLIREWNVLSICRDDIDRKTIHKTRNRASPDQFAPAGLKRINVSGSAT